MKNLQEAINNHVMNSRNHKRYLAALIAMSMLVSFMVPFLLIEPAVSMTNDSDNGILALDAGTMIPNLNNGTTANNDGSPGSISDVTLLIGESSNGSLNWASGANSAADVIERAKNEYFLGIAYDFSVFLEENFQPTAADAEGRVAVGGSIIYNNPAHHNYQIGAGDYTSSTALKDTDNYIGLENFAHLILGSKPFPIYNVESTEHNGNWYYDKTDSLLVNSQKAIIDIATYGTTKSGTEFATVDPYKRIVVPHNFDINSDDNYHNGNEKYQNGHSHLGHNIDELATFYQTNESNDLIDFTAQFAWLKEQSAKLKEIKSTGTCDQSDFLYNKEGDPYNTPSLILDANGADKDAKSVYFNVTEEQWNAITLDDEWNRQIIYQNIPKYTDENGEVHLANIIVNVAGKKPFIKKAIHTKIEDEYISANSDGTGNNHKYSENILYNFYEAEEMILNGGFNGTIFAPYADVKSKNGDNNSAPGHLSGALIAKSYKGGMEFGYRPYRGKNSDILGSKSGYVVPFDKFITETVEHLPGASFEVKDESGNTVASWTSGDETQYAAIPTGVDFTGGVNYSNSAPIEHTYTVQESKAPTGYHPLDKTYTVKVTENVNTNYLIPIDGKGTIPQVVDVNVEISSNGDETTTFNFQIRDVYSDNDSSTDLKPVQRQVIFNDIVYVLNINNGTVTSVGTTEINNIAELTTSTETQDITPEEQDSDNEQNVPDENVDSDTEPTETASDNNTENSEPVQESSEVPSAQPSSESSPSDEESVGLTKIDTITPVLDENGCKTSGKIGETNYYYDNKSIMVMPLPSNTPTFENKPGLLFTKVDKTTGEILEKAEISITPEYTGFDANSGSFLFDIENLGTGVYTLTEDTPPAGYEKADPIHFKKDSDGKLCTCDSNGNSAVEMDKTNGYYTFSMEDIKISGVIPSLKKTDENDAILAGASFELWAKDGTSAICSWENFSGKEISMKEKLLTVTDTTYVVNGYLKPGVYYLEETVIPKKNGKDYYENPGKMYFTVDKDFTITNGYVDAKQLKVVQADPHEIKFGAEDGSVLNNITSITWESNGVKSIYDTDPTINDIDGNYHNNYTYTAKAFNQKSGNNYAFKLANWGDGKPNLEVYYVEVIADGQKYIYNNRPSNASLMALSSNDADKENGISPLAEGEIKELSLDKFEDNSSDRPIFKSKDGSKINNAKYIYVESNDSQVQIYNTDSSPWEGKKVNVRENKKPENANIASFNNIKLQTCNKWGNGFEVTYVRITAEDGTQYIYGTPSGDVPEPSDDGGGNTGGNTGDNPGGNTGSNGESIENPHLTVTDKLLTVKNTRPGDNKSITVEKVWEDGEFKSGRTDITIQLYRTTDTVDYNNLPTNDDANKVGDAVTLNASGDTPWKYTWSTLPSYVENSDDTWNYYVKEVSTPSGYTVQYSASGNEFKITNTLQKDEISITKKWENASETNLTKPTQLNVTLKFTVNGTQQTKTVTLTPKEDGSGDYTGSYEIPKGATDVSVEEHSVPTGWKLKENGIVKDNNNFTITNVPDTTQLTVKKEWVNDTQSSRPQQIHFKLYRKAQSGGSSGGDVADAPNFNPNLTNKLVPDYTDDKYTSKNITQYNDYARLLQYSLYFYDANMCGSDVSEKSAFSKTKNQTNGWRDDCHTYTTDKDYVDGGFHDAGDHLMLGLPQGFTAATLGWSYYEFRNSYDSLGLTDHYKTIMEYFCDFFVNSVRYNGDDVSELLVQKGSDGGNQRDHAYWGSPEAQQQNEFGKMWWESSNVSNVAAEYAAALAIYKLSFPNDSKSDNYIDVAKKLYAFAEKSNGCWGAEGLYKDKECESEKAWAAAWLYLATKDSSYKEKCENLLNTLNITENRGYFWGDVTPGAMTVYTKYIAPNESYSNKIEAYLNGKCTNSNTLRTDYDNENWGELRHNTLTQFIALMYDKDTYKDWCASQMGMILGNNSISCGDKRKVCFVTGFNTYDDTYSPQYYHHKAASGYPSWNEFNSAKGGNPTKYKNVLVGALVGGPTQNNKSVYNDNINDTHCNEVALDYNAGLVGAAAGLYAVYGTGETYSNVNATPQNDESADANTLSAIGPVKLNLNREVSVLADDDESYTWEQTFKAGEAYALPSNVLGKKITSIDVYYTIGDYWGYFKYGHTHQYDDGGKRYKQLGEVAYDDIKNKNMVTISSLSCTDNITDFSFGEIGNATISKLVIHYTDSPDPPSEETTTSNTTTTQKQETTTTVATNTTPTTPSGLVAHEYPFNGQTITNLNLEHVKKIAIVFDSNVTANGMLKLNDDYENTILPGNTDPSQKGNNKWDINNSNRFEYGEVDMTVTKFEFNIWGGDSCNTGKIIFYTEAEGLTLTPTNAEIEEGGEITLTASGAEGSVSWEIDDPNNLINTNSQSGNTCTITAKDNVNGTVTITAKADGKTKTATITIKAKEITGLPEAVKLHVGKLAQLSPVPADNVSYNSGNEAVATVDNNGNITAKSTGDTVITVSRNGESVSVPVHVLGNLSITGNGIMNKNATQQLTAANAVGAVKWSINPDSNEPKIKIDPDTGVVTSETGTGNATVIATDSDGTTAEFNIIVNLTAVQPDLPEGAEQVQNVGEGGIITLTKDDLKSDGSWQKEIANLPKTDSSGNVYVYYLEEVDAQGTPIRTCIAGNNGVNYYPVEYINNGMTLNDSDKTITVKNEASEKPENPDYTLPNTGGIGTGGFTTAGGAIIIGSTALYILSKRRRKKNVVR